MSANEELNEINNNNCCTHLNEQVNAQVKDAENSEENSNTKLIDENSEYLNEVNNEEENYEATAVECAAGGTALGDIQGPSNLERLFQRQRIELAFELRRLQFSERPVSNQDNKKRLEEFLNENVHNPSQSQNVPHRDPAAYRPENMLNEIEALSSQQRVSTILSNARERLESTLRRFLSPVPPIRLTQTNVRVQSTSSLQQEPLTTGVNQSNAYSNGLHSSQNSITSSLSTATNNVILQTSDGSTNLFAPVTAFVPVAQIENSAVMRNTIEQIRREHLIDEISELVHQQLVTSTLESQFRTRLEALVQDRIRNNGINVQGTREFIRNINQTSNIQRNDFSNLGIYNNNRDAQRLDNIDSASTYQAQTAQRATASTREIRMLQSEIKELKNMMKLSFELQLDMQRSLKQEISALIAGTFLDDKHNTNHKNKSQSSINACKPASEGQCLICTENFIDAVFYQCGHMCACYSCAMILKQRSDNCPVCRAPIKDILRAYRCN